jgi:hypothetical protein
MSDSFDETCFTPDESFVENLVSHADVRRERGGPCGDLAQVDVRVDDSSASGYALDVWVDSECAVRIRPRDDDGYTVFLRNHGDLGYGPFEVDVPPRCLIAKRGSSSAQEQRALLGKTHPLTSFASLRGYGGKEVTVQVACDSRSASGFALEVVLPYRPTIVVRPCDDGDKLVALRLCGESEEEGYMVVEVEIPEHVIRV